MPTITAGTTQTVYCPLASTITITPGEAGRVSINTRGRNGGQGSAAPRDIIGATTIDVGAGDTVSIEAISSDATYTTPAGADTALSALVSVDGNLTAAELLTTTGTPGQTVRLSDGDDKGAILTWAIPEGASAYTWCWWLWPQASYL